MRPVRAKALYIVRYFKAFALSGRQVTAQNKNPGRCPGLRASALSGRAAVGYLIFRALLLWAFGRAAYMGFWPFGRCCPMQISQNFRAVWLKLPCMPFCMVEITQHALKGQKLLAQGNALGINDIQLTPCKGKSFTYRRGFSHFY